MGEPKISIVVPVYNVEKFLPKCLDSIAAQTYKNWEAVLVDDGCTDSSGKICDQYASKDNRFVVVHKENGGVSTARNRGIELCKGDWCCFIDSDDWIENSYLQNFMIEGYNNCGCVLQSFHIMDANCESTEFVELPNKRFNSASELVFFLEFTRGVHNGFLWHRLFNLHTIKDNNISFPVGISFAEDGIFFLNYLLCSNFFATVSKGGYHYIIREGSLTGKEKNIPRENLANLYLDYSKLIELIIKKEHPNNDIASGLRLFLNRIIYGWVIKRNLKTENDYKLNHYFVANFIRTEKIPGFNFFDSIIQKLIRKVLDTHTTTFRYKELKFLLKIHDVMYNREMLKKCVLCKS